MNFLKATDALLETVTLEDLAEALGVSTQSVRQARVSETSAAHRTPPSGWELGVKSLAKRRIIHLQRVIKSLK